MISLESLRMRGMTAALAAASALAMAGFLAAPASAAPPPPGCARIPILGLNPQIMKICDEPMNPDGSWVRGRQFTQPQFVGSTCDPAYEYRNSNGTWLCPSWAADRTAAWEGPVDTYVLTADTVPPGEPGYIGCPDPECF